MGTEPLSGPPASGPGTPGASPSARAGVAWQSLSFVAAKLLGLGSLLILTRLLAPSEFGVVAAILTFISVVELGSDLGMKPTVIYEQEHGITSRVRTAFTLNLLVAVVLAAVGVLLAPGVAALLEQRESTDLFRLATVNVALVGLANVHDATLMRDLAFDRRIRTELLRAVVQATVSIGLAFAGLEAAALVWGLLAGTAAWVTLHWSMTRIRPSLRFDRSTVTAMSTYGGAASVLQILGIIGSRLDVVVIARVLGERALGLYTIAFRLPEILIESVAVNLSLVAFPAFARKRVAEEEGLGAATLLLVRYQSLYALPLAAGMATLSVPIVNVLFSNEWSDASGVLSGVAVMAGLSAFVFPLGDLFKALGRQPLLIALNLVFIPVIIVALIATASTGIVAVAWGRAVAEGVWVVLIVFSVTRLLDLRVIQIAAAAWPGVVAAAGVAAGAGAVRLAWDSAGLAELLGAATAGALAGATLLRVLAPAAFAEVRALVAGLLSRLRPATGPAR